MTKNKKRLRIGITTGDINGIGPELIIRGFQDARIKELCTPIIYGSPRVLNAYRKILNIEKFTYNVIQTPEQAQPRKLSVLDCVTKGDRMDPGQPGAEAGEAAYQSLMAGVADLKANEIDALVTLPIDKSTIQQEGFQFPGHTEYLANAFGVEDSLMFMVSDRLKIGVVSGHVPLREVSKGITANKVYSKLKIMHESLRKDFNIEKPRIAVLGLNPHAGDNGLLGNEDQEFILKALQRAEKEKILAIGPYPADGFFGTGTYSKFDATLAMYHDQGLIPFKLMAGFEGVNFTAGLPGIRTSPDHGVAYNLVGKDLASLDSFFHAIYAAIDIIRCRYLFDSLEEDALKPTEGLSKGRGRKENYRKQKDRDTGVSEDMISPELEEEDIFLDPEDFVEDDPEILPGFFDGGEI